MQEYSFSMLAFSINDDGMFSFHFNVFHRMKPTFRTERWILSWPHWMSTILVNAPINVFDHLFNVCLKVSPIKKDVFCEQSLELLKKVLKVEHKAIQSLELSRCIWRKIHVAIKAFDLFRKIHQWWTLNSYGHAMSNKFVWNINLNWAWTSQLEIYENIVI